MATDMLRVALGRNVLSEWDVREALVETRREGRFFFDKDELGRLARRFADEYPQGADEVVKYAGRICAHEFDLLGAAGLQSAECRAQNAEQNIPWHTDIGTGRRWKKRYSALLPVQFNGDESDIKRVWELSRCQHFGALGIAHLIAECRMQSAECRVQSE